MRKRTNLDACFFCKETIKVIDVFVKYGLPLQIKEYLLSTDRMLICFSISILKIYIFI